MRPGRGATVGVVTELMDVDSTLSIGIIASDIPRDSRWGRFGGLLEGDSALDVRVSSKNSD